MRNGQFRQTTPIFLKLIRKQRSPLSQRGGREI
jgi:hypothetical protein